MSNSPHIVRKFDPVRNVPTYQPHVQRIYDPFRVPTYPTFVAAIRP